MAVVDNVRKVFGKVFGTRNDRLIKGYRRRLAAINAFEGEMRKLTDSELAEKTVELRARVASGDSEELVIPEAFAVMRESMDRNIGIRNIFNPLFADQFDESGLPDDARKIYEELREEIKSINAVEVLGGETEVEGWLNIDIPVRLYDAVREIYQESRPPFRTRAFDVQLIGGMVLAAGRIAEMKTGEGKTIVAPLACYMAAIEGLQCHVVTTNATLVQRDRDWVFPAFHKLGMHVGAIHPVHRQPTAKKKEAYQCDVVYGTSSEFGFDYLRDNMKLNVVDQVQKHREFCIVDEVDSILIDEARTPLIISGPAHDDAPQYMQADEVAKKLFTLQKKANQMTRERIGKPDFVANQAKRMRRNEGEIEKIVMKFRDLGADFLDEKESDIIEHKQYYVVRRESKSASMTALGIEEAQNIIGVKFYVVGNDMGWDHIINQAVVAHTVYENDTDYIVEGGEVVIIDVNTGHKMVGRQWSHGLHQAIEAKESRHGVKIKEETQTWATITVQNFFKLYDRLSGMTGTAVTEATEFLDIYGLDVVCIPTNLLVIRKDDNDLIYLTEKGKWDAILEEIKDHTESGRPVLVGTTSVEKSMQLSGMLTKKYGIEHEVLNAKQHEREAKIVAMAGQQHVDNRDRTMGNVTISTNMAGRGTDIRVPEEAMRLGGLHIVGTERHESRRIDNQLRGRSGRQGDMGSSRFFLSMEDDLMKMFAGKATMKAMSMMGMKEDDAIEHKMLTKSVERAQKKVEEKNYQMRKNVLEYDEVMEYQRNTFYGTRQKVLEGRGIKELIFEYIAEAVEDAVEKYMAKDYVPTQVSEGIRSIYNVNIDPVRLRGKGLKELETRIRSDAKADARQEIENSLFEYMSNDIDREDWDLKGLQTWAMSRFNVDLKLSKLRDAEPEELAEELSEAAYGLIDRKSLDSLEKFYAKDYVENELAAWANQKFDLELTAEDFRANRNESDRDLEQRLAELIYQKAEERYQRREILYPISFELEMVFNAVQQGGGGSAWAAEQLCRWANQRYDMRWKSEQVKEMKGDEIHEALVKAAEEWNGAKLDDAIDEALRGGGEGGRKWLRERFDLELSDEDLADVDEDDDEELKEILREKAVGVMRTEMTQLEQFVLLQILDQAWKDHLYAMDQLRDTIGLRGFAERDPKTEYKREGARMFVEMLKSVRDKVTDMIYRARLSANIEMRDAYAGQTASHDTQDTTGVAVGGTQQQREEQAIMEQAGSEKGVVKSIRRTHAKVGRNDPCPCGSGKKYKKCCGAQK